MDKERFLILLTVILVLTVFVFSSAAGADILQKKIIVIDSGHGGRDSGIISSIGFTEKDFSLKLATRLQARLKNQYKVLLTRKDDKFLTNTQRISFANYNKADLYISIHLKNSTASQSGFYFYDQPSSSSLTSDSIKDNWQYQYVDHIEKAVLSVTFCYQDTKTIFSNQKNILCPLR